MAEARVLTIRAFRHDPADQGSVPRLQDYTVTEEPGMNLFTALHRIRDEQDPSIAFDFSCRSAVCGSCGMLVNGKPRLACRTLTRDLPALIQLMPMPVFRLIRDLSVDTGVWFRGMNGRIESWLHEARPFDPTAPEERMDQATAEKVYDADRCIECGLCVAGCATAAMRPGFLGAAGLNRIGRFVLDPRDTRSAADFSVLSTGEGVFGCLGLLGCHDYCPKDLPLRERFAYLRRSLAWNLLGLGGRKR
ncbi:MAG: fumarate reductase iron-sulfur subunit [Candidatus Coatesbacteria bacterium]